MAWDAADFYIASMIGNPEKVNGYVYRGLGLHMAISGSPKGRRKPKWALSHLNSGHRICAITGDVATAFPIATEIADCADWDFDGLRGYQNTDPDLPLKVRAVFDKHENAIDRGHGRSDDDAARSVLMARGV